MSHEAKTEAELFEDLRAGKEGSWEAFVRRLAPIVYAVPRRMGLSDADADEVVQATWVVLFRHAKWISRPGSVVSWVLTTAGREAGRLRSRARRRVEIEEASLAERDAEDEQTPEDVVAQLERVQLVRDAIDRLGDPCKGLLSALYVEPDSSYKDVAERLGMPVGSIGPTRQRCFDKLLRALGGKEA